MAREAKKNTRKSAKSMPPGPARKERRKKTRTKTRKAAKTAPAEHGGRKPASTEDIGMLTTGRVADICGVSGQTVAKWFDKGLLKGHLLPGTKRRRVTGEELARFRKKYGIPDLEQ